MKKILIVYGFILLGGILSSFAMKTEISQPAETDKYYNTTATVKCPEGDIKAKVCFGGAELVCNADPDPCNPPPAE